MSFLPHGRPGALSWYGSFAASFTAHTALVSFVVFSGVVILTPRPPEPEETPEITVSLEILDANIVEELEPVDETNLVPEDAEITEPDAPEAETPEDLAALSPEEQELLAPDDQELLTPDADDALEPEVLEPEPQEPDITEPDLTEPDVIEPEPELPQLAEPEAIPPEVIAPEPIEPEVAQPEIIAPEPVIEEAAPETQVADVPDLPDPAPLPLPAVEQPFAIDDISPIDDSVLNPLATGGSAVAPVNDDVFALVAPEPEQPQTAVLQPDVVDDIEPVVLPEAEDDTTAAIAPAPEVISEPELAPVIASEPELAPEIVPEIIPEPEVAPEIIPEIIPEPEVAPEILPEIVPEPELAPEILPEIVPEPEAIVEPEPTLEPQVVEEAPEIPEVAPDLPDPEASPEPDAEPGPPVETETAAAPTRAPLANPSASDVAIGQLLRRIRATPQEQCTLALPRRVSGDSALAGLSMVGAREDQLDALATRILDGLDFAPVQTRELLDPRQCATLDALRQSDSYPANRIGLSLSAATLASGDVLTGRIVGCLLYTSPSPRDRG